jgi:hypothetical protein
MTVVLISQGRNDSKLERWTSSNQIELSQRPYDLSLSGVNLSCGHLQWSNCSRMDFIPFLLWSYVIKNIIHGFILQPIVDEQTQENYYFMREVETSHYNKNYIRLAPPLICCC